MRVCVCVCAGNLMAVSIIKMIGLTMGLTVWGVTNMLSGWVTGMYASYHMTLM